MSEEIFHLGIKALIRNKTGNILLLQVNPQQLSGEKRNYWDLPGGRVQKGDTVEATLRREIAEETGIQDIADMKLINTVMSNIRIPVGGTTVGLILSIFNVHVRDNAKITLSNEHIDAQWVSPVKAAELLMVKYPKTFCDAIAVLP